MPGFEILQNVTSPSTAVLTPTYGIIGGTAPSGNIVINNDPVPVPVIVGNQGAPTVTTPTSTGAQQEAVLDPGTPTILPATDSVAGGDVKAGGDSPAGKKWYDNWYVWVIGAAVLVGAYFVYKKVSK